MKPISAHLAYEVYPKNLVPQFSISEKVREYFTSVVFVEKEVNQWYSIPTPVIGVYSTEIAPPDSQKKKSHSKKSLFKCLLKFFS